MAGRRFKLVDEATEQSAIDGDQWRRFNQTRAHQMAPSRLNDMLNVSSQRGPLFQLESIFLNISRPSPSQTASISNLN